LDTHSHPLDEWVTKTITEACRVAIPQKHQIRWSHEVSEGRLVAMQRAAAVSGLAPLDTGSQLSIHPLYGMSSTYSKTILTFP
jgi:hypothetical protein